MLRFPETPAVYYCHGWAPWEETPLVFPRIFRYLAVDEVCRERLIAEGGIAPARIELLLNFFNARNFAPRGPLPAKPQLALAFGNAFSENSDLPILREACAQCGIELHAAGLAALQPESDVGQRLQRYDLVFAKARGAIEAMAVGAAVVLCNLGRLGSMVTSKNFSRLRPLNFGVRVLDRPLEAKLVTEEIGRYDAADALRVATVVRGECEIQSVVDRLISLYESVIEEARRAPLQASAPGDHAVARYLEQHSLRYKGRELTSERDRWIAQYRESETDRDRWMNRCLASETDRDRWMNRCLASETDRDRWMNRCLASETDRDRWAARCLGSESEQERWRNRCLSAEADLDRSVRASSELEQALAQALSEGDAARALGDQRQQAFEQLDQKWQERVTLLNLQWSAIEKQSEDAWLARYAERTREWVALKEQMADMLSWPLWRIIKYILEGYPMRRFLRPALRAMRTQWRLRTTR